MPIDLLEKPKSHIKLESIDPVEKVVLKANKKVRFGTTLNKDVKKDLINIKRQDNNFFLESRRSDRGRSDHIHA